MSETKWTPGPWRLATNDPTIVMAGENTIVADVLCVEGAAKPHDFANAALIAAAPAMYEALKKIDEWLMQPWSEQDVLGGAVHPAFRDALLATRAAIAAAEGR